MPTSLLCVGVCLRVGMCMCICTVQHMPCEPKLLVSFLMRTDDILCYYYKMREMRFVVLCALCFTTDAARRWSKLSKSNFLHTCTLTRLHNELYIPETNSRKCYSQLNNSRSVVVTIFNEKMKSIFSFYGFWNNYNWIMRCEYFELKSKTIHCAENTTTITPC